MYAVDDVVNAGVVVDIASVNVDDAGVDVMDSCVDVVDSGVDVMDSGFDVVDAGVDVVDVWVDVVYNGVVAGTITLLVRLMTASSIMHKRIILVLYCTWQYAPFGRP